MAHPTDENGLHPTGEKPALLEEAQRVLDEVEPLVAALYADPANALLPPGLVLQVAVLVWKAQQERDRGKEAARQVVHPGFNEPPLTGDWKPR